MIESIEFSLISPQMIKKIAAVEITRAELYDNDGFPLEGGVMDPRLGVIDPGLRCRTCGKPMGADLGHFGYVEVVRPVVHVLYAKLIYRILKMICRECGKVIASSPLTTIKKCPHCSAEQKPIRFEKPYSYFEGETILTPLDIRARFEKIPDEDLPLLKMKGGRPEWLILTVLLVPPVIMRPSITLETGERSEDDLTHKLVDIIRINQRLKENIEIGAPDFIIGDLWELLQYHAATFFDNTLSGIPAARHRSGRPLKTLADRLKSKEGRFRQNLTGKRVNFSARTVISPDPLISINEVGVPLIIAKELTIPVTVTEHNIDYIRKIIINSPNWPSVNYIVRPDEKRKKVTEETKEEIVKEISPGYIIERHLQNGDIVLFNRQPSLHRMSIMAHRIRVTPWRTFTLNLCVCPPYNADFDGDEMNLHVLQTEEAQAEASLLMEVQRHIRSPRFGGPIIGCRQDHISGCYKLTHKETKLTREEAFKLLSDIGANSKLANKKVFTGKEVFSHILPKDLNIEFKAKVCGCENCIKGTCPNDGYVVIRNGELIRGVIDSKAIGSEHGKLIDVIEKGFGTEAAHQFIDHVSRLGIKYLDKIGFTIGLDDITIPEDILSKIKNIIQKAEEEVNSLIEDYKQGKILIIPGRTALESLESHILYTLSKVTEDSERLIKNSMGENNATTMAKTGARGSMTHIAQLTASVGQSRVLGERIHRGYSFGNRTLSHFTVGDLSPMAHGFLKNSFKGGLSPFEFFFDAMSGRESLMDKSLRTRHSGYLERRLMNALQDLKIEYDGTIRDNRKVIIQFTPGEDNIDPSKSDWGVLDVKAIIQSIQPMKTDGGTEKMTLEKAKQVLPKKIIEDTKGVFKEMKLTEAQKSKAIAKVVDIYYKSSFEPGEAVGVISAQSISEPGTQMSIDFNEKILIKENGMIKPIRIGEFIDNLMKVYDFKIDNSSEILDLNEDHGLYVYSLDKDEKLKLKRIKAVIRHKSPKKLLKIKTSSGRKIIATDHHSFVIRKENKIIPISGKLLRIGDRIPAMKYLPEHSINQITLSSTIQSRNLFKNNNQVFPYITHSKGLPDSLDLNSELGWFIGAYLSEGNATNNFVNISNTDERFKQKVREFANNFNFTFNEYDNFRGFSIGHDIRINSSLLSLLLKETCGTNSHNKHVPIFAFSAKEDFIKFLLQAYFDGDGNITIDRKGIRASSESKELLDGIAILLARFGIFCSKSNNGKSIWIPYKYAKIFLEKIGSLNEDKKEKLIILTKKWKNKKIRVERTDMIPGISTLLFDLAKNLKYPTRYVNNFTVRQKIGRSTLEKYIKLFEKLSSKSKIDISKELKILKIALNSDAVWDEIEEIEYVDPSSDYVYDISVDGLETFTTFDGIITHNTMRTYHVAGATEIQATLGLPRLIEIFDARRVPKVPTMAVHLQKSYNTKEKAHQIAAEIQETKLRSVATQPALDLLNMQIEIPLDPTILRERGLKLNKIADAVKENFKDVNVKIAKDKVMIKPKEEHSIKELQKLKTKILELHIKGVKNVSQVIVIQKDDEWVLNTLGSNLAKVLAVPGVDSARTITNNIHEVLKVLGIEAARQSIVNEAMKTLEEGGLEVDVRHVMLVADVMTADGIIKAIGRYGVAGAKGSVLAKANFEETIKHLTKAAINAEIDKLDSIVENVMINQVVPVGTGMFDLIFKPKEK